MNVTNIVLLVIGIIFLLESLFFLVFGDSSKKLILRMIKADNLKRVARWELAIAIILLILSAL